MLKSNRPCLSVEETKAYLNNKLNEQQRFEIEHHVQDCELCEAALEGYAQSKIEPEVPNIDKIREQISRDQQAPTQDKQTTKSAKVTSMRPRINWLVAASFLALCSAAIWFYSNRNDDLYADFHSPYTETVLASRAGDAIPNEAFSKGMDAFEKGNYEESLSFLEAAKLKDPENSNIALYAGLAALETGSTNKSTEWLAEARINQPNAYGTATWYLAMAHLSDEDFAACRNMLKQLSPEDEPYYDKAQPLIKKLQDK